MLSCRCIDRAPCQEVTSWRLRIISVAAITILASSGAVALADEGPIADAGAVAIEEPTQPASDPVDEPPPAQPSPEEPAPGAPASEEPAPAPDPDDPVGEPVPSPTDPNLPAEPPAPTPDASPEGDADAGTDSDEATPVGGVPAQESDEGGEDEGGCLKLACEFQLDFVGFPEGDLTASYRIDLWNPSGSGELGSGTVQVGEDAADGDADVDATVVIDLTPELLAAVDDGAKPRPNGFHVRLTVDVPGEGVVMVDGHRLTRGHGEEPHQGGGPLSKVFWVDCPELPQPPDDDGCPKLQGCVVPIRFSGFPQGDHVAVWTILLWHPSGAGELASGAVFIGEDPAGGITDLDAQVRVRVADALRDAGAIRKHNGFHIRVVVAVQAEGVVTIAGSPMEEHEGEESHEGEGGLTKTLWIDCDLTEPEPEPNPEPEPKPEPKPEPETRVLGGGGGLPDGTAFTGADVRRQGVAALALALLGLLALAVTRRPAVRPAGAGTSADPTDAPLLSVKMETPPRRHG